jgi:hypothetical protein
MVDGPEEFLPALLRGLVEAVAVGRFHEDVIGVENLGRILEEELA